MQIDKSQVIELLKSKGENDKASQAESELPEKIDTDKNSGQLSRLGIDTQDLLGKLPGSFGG